MINIETTPHPKTVDEAIDLLFNNLNGAEISFIKENDPASVHHWFGMAIRNGWKLWEDPPVPLREDFIKRFNLFGHADDVSGLIMEGVWAKVRGENVTKKLEEVANEFNAHWLREGVCPFTGKSARDDDFITGSD